MLQGQSYSQMCENIYNAKTTNFVFFNFEIKVADGLYGVFTIYMR